MIRVKFGGRMSDKISINSLKLSAIDAAHKAGEILRKGYGTQFTVSHKGSPHDLVTEYDKKAEEAIISHLSHQYPTHAILAEESGASYHSEAPVKWVIDPLDGTMNFAHHIPMFCVSIAAVINNKTEVGVIYDPLLNELFVAERGKGAFLNGKQIKVSNVDVIEKSVMATGFPYGSSELRDQCVNQFIDFLEIANPIRIIGSAALTLAYIACGRFDLYWGSNLKPWDVAAGCLLIEEAGGKLTHFDGSALDMFLVSNTLATNSQLHAEALRRLK